MPADKAANASPAAATEAAPPVPTGRPKRNRSKASYNEKVCLRAVMCLVVGVLLCDACVGHVMHVCVVCAAADVCARLDGLVLRVQMLENNIVGEPETKRKKANTEPVYDVKEILGKRKVGKQTQYKVRVSSVLVAFSYQHADATRVVAGAVGGLQGGG